MGVSALVQFCSAADPSSPPTRPDFSTLAPAQAEKANAEYSAALKEWERIEVPRRKAAIEEAIKIQDARKEKLADPLWKPTPVTNVASLGLEFTWEADAQSKGLDEATCALLRRENLDEAFSTAAVRCQKANPARTSATTKPPPRLAIRTFRRFVSARRLSAMKACVASVG